MKPSALTLVGVLVASILLSAERALAQNGANVLLVGNALSPASEEIASYYARARGIPGQNMLRLPLEAKDEIERGDYETKIEKPIADWLAANTAYDRILYLVLTKDVPLRIAGSGGPNGNIASVDSELTVLYRRLYGTPTPTAGSVRNPYFTGATPSTPGVRFTHRTHDIYLVGRLDGYTVADVKGMIDRAASPSREGTVLLDGKFELTESVGNRWLSAAAAAIKRIYGWSDRVQLDGGQPVLRDKANVIGYYSWGSNAVNATERDFGLKFLPGAIGAEYVSTDARTFKEPPADWVINDTKKPFGGSHQSLIGDLIRQGITGVAGHVAEPLLSATIRPDALFPAYVSGFNLIESFYMAMPALSWQTIVVGDPLCAPFGPRPFPAADLNPPVDPDTELPQYFSARRLAVIMQSGAKPEVAKWIAKYETRGHKKDEAGAREALEKATVLDPAYAPGHLALALMAEKAGEWDSAIERYRLVIEQTPNHAVALNNLAFALATRKHQATEAFPFASKAYALSVQDPIVGDTLAWIYHLMGNDTAAEPIISVSVRRRPDVAEIQLHAAFILNGVGRASTAAQHLDTALKLDAALGERPEVKELLGKVRLPAAK